LICTYIANNSIVAVRDASTYSAYAIRDGLLHLVYTRAGTSLVQDAGTGQAVAAHVRRRGTSLVAAGLRLRRGSRALWRLSGQYGPSLHRVINETAFPKRLRRACMWRTPVCSCGRAGRREAGHPAPVTRPGPPGSSGILITGRPFRGSVSLGPINGPGTAGLRAARSFSAPSPECHWQLAARPPRRAGARYQLTRTSISVVLGGQPRCAAGTCTPG
jgi:hypothetical protein